MIFCYNLPHNKAYIQSVYMPYDKTLSTLHSVIFSNNINYQSILDLGEKPILKNSYKFRSYYIEPMYRVKVGTKTIVSNERKSRKELYEIIASTKNGPTPYLTIDASRGRNLYYDMYRYNEIFFNNSKRFTLIKKIDLYFKYISDIIHDGKFNEYTFKSMFIDVEAWGKYDKINNPITYIVYALKKYFDKFQTLGDVNMCFYTKDKILRLNPSECDDKTYIKFNTEINKLYKSINFNSDELDTIISDDVISTINVVNTTTDTNDIKQPVSTLNITNKSKLGTTRDMEKVSNFKFNEVYFGSPTKYNRDMTIDRPLFITPYQGIASIFIGKDDIKSLGIPPGSYNLKYDEWSLNTNKLQKPLLTVHVIVEGLPDMEERTVHMKGYIHVIDSSMLQDNIYRYKWMSPDVEFLLAGIDKISFKKVIEHDVTYIIKGVSSNNPNHGPYNAYGQTKNSSVINTVARLGVNNKSNFTGDDDIKLDSELENIEDDIEIVDGSDNIEIDNDIDPVVVNIAINDNIDPELAEEISQDAELLNQVNNLTKLHKTGKTTASLARDTKLREEQKNVNFKGLTIEKYMETKKVNPDIKTTSIEGKVNSTNPHIKELKYKNFEKTYNEEVYPRDMINMITHLNNLSIPVYVKDIKVEDTSTNLTLQETYKITLEDENRVRHNITVDVPKFYEDKFLYIEGNKKIINKQLFMKPISKTGPATVQICNNYNKIFMYRHGDKISSRVEKFKKAISTDDKIKVMIGDNTLINNAYMTTLEYDELAANYYSISNNGVEIILDQSVIKEKLKDFKLPVDTLCVGFKKGNPILLNHKTEKIKDVNGEVDLITYMVNNFHSPFKEIYDGTETGTKKYSYTRAKVMNKFIPIILLLGYCEGISTVLKKANVNHYFSDKRVTENDDQGVIAFGDGYLVFDKYPYSNSLLLNGLMYVNTKPYTFDDFNSKDVYIDIFETLYGARNLANAFDSFYEFLVDPITKEILEQLDYPTDFVSVLLVGNELLSDNSFIKENDMNLYRIRSNEVIPALLYHEIATAYSKYRATAYNKNPVKISIPRNAVMKKLASLQTLEEFSTLNPIYELDKLRSITPKGLNGMNLDRAYKEDKRSYDKTMLGVLGISTSPGASVGVVRKLSLEPNIKNARGFIDINDDKKSLDSIPDVSMFTVPELLTPVTVMHDDTPRTAMASKQSLHIIPVKNTSPVLISNGIEQTMQHYLSSDFIITSEQDGKCVEYDDATGIIIIEYKDGTHKAVDINHRVCKNSASGFYLSNKLVCNLKVGDTVKKNDIIAYDKNFFKDDKVYGNRFNIGSLQKVAIMSTYSTFEDSTFITEKVTEDMSSDIVMMKDCSIGKNSNVDKMVKVGDEVSVGDILISFETSYDDESYNQFLSSVGDELKDELKSLNRVPIKSKYTGIVEDIKIYATVELDELSPTLKKIVSDYYKKINYKKKVISKYDKSDGVIKCGLMITDNTEKLTPSADGKIKGRKVFDGVLIEFYIKYHNVMHVGDKLTNFSALKSIVGEIIPKGYEPYSEHRPNEEIGTAIGPSAILARQTPLFNTLFGNKVLVELKYQLEEIYKE